jgi:NADH-quinone oxidoreductase subunit A
VPHGCRIEGAPRPAIAVISREFQRVPSVPPTADFLSVYASVLVFLAVIVGLLLFMLVLWKVLRPARFSEEKLTTYECGEEPVGNAWIQFNIRFYVFALIFVVFDVEAVFLLPWATVFRELGLLAYLEGLVFIGILVVALAYVWRKGDLAWVRPEDKS